MRIHPFLLSALLALVPACQDSGNLPAPPPETAMAKELAALGKLLFTDTNLSTPPGQACATCHDPMAGFADPRPNGPTSLGAIDGRFGNRNAPTAAYQAFTPPFHYSENEISYEGGLFWDGRVNDLEQQAQKPMLNPLEMNNPDGATVVAKVRVASYAPRLLAFFGTSALDTPTPAFAVIAQAIAAYERSLELNPFSSKYDLYMAGKAQLTAQELHGLSLYQDHTKGNCDACHPSQPGRWAPHALFTDFTYDNIGIPRNPDSRFYSQDTAFNPDGVNYVDHGLGSVLSDPGLDGKFKVPTLRNIALTAPYGHNGYFKTLRDIVQFYNKRDMGNYPPPEVPGTENLAELGNLRLTDADVDDLVAFLNTLTDGYQP